MKIDKFTVIHTSKKILMVMVLLVALACTMMGCGIQKHNDYVGALNSLGNSITSKENQSISMADEFKEDPSDMDVRTTYGRALMELADLYGGYADISALDEVAAEHQELVDASNGISELYGEMAVVMLDKEIDFTKDVGLNQLLSTTENLGDLTGVFAECLDALIAAVNN